MRIPKLIFEVLMETIHFLWHRAVNKHLSESNSKTEHFSSSVWDLEVIFTIPWDSSMNKIASIRVWCIAALRAWCNSWRRIWIAVAAAVSEIRISLSHASARRTTSVTTSTDRHVRWTPTRHVALDDMGIFSTWQPQRHVALSMWVALMGCLGGKKKHQRYQPTEHDMTCGSACHPIYWLRFIFISMLHHAAQNIYTETQTRDSWLRLRLVRSRWMCKTQTHIMFSLVLGIETYFECICCQLNHNMVMKYNMSNSNKWSSCIILENTEPEFPSWPFRAISPISWHHCSFKIHIDLPCKPVYLCLLPLAASFHMFRNNSPKCSKLEVICHSDDQHHKLELHQSLSCTTP